MYSFPLQIAPTSPSPKKHFLKSAGWSSPFAVSQKYVTPPQWPEIRVGGQVGRGLPSGPFGGGGREAGEDPGGPWLGGSGGRQPGGCGGSPLGPGGGTPLGPGAGRAPRGATKKVMM